VIWRPPGPPLQIVCPFALTLNLFLEPGIVPFRSIDFGTRRRSSGQTLILITCPHFFSITCLSMPPIPPYWSSVPCSVCTVCRSSYLSVPFPALFYLQTFAIILEGPPFVEAVVSTAWPSQTQSANQPFKNNCGRRVIRRQPDLLYILSVPSRFLSRLKGLEASSWMGLPESSLSSSCSALRTSWIGSVGTSSSELIPGSLRTLDLSQRLNGPHLNRWHLMQRARLRKVRQEQDAQDPTLWQWADRPRRRPSWLLVRGK